MSAHAPALPLEADPLIAEAKQRARRRRLIVAAALLAAGGAAAGVLAFGSTGSAGSSGTIPWLPTRPQLAPAHPPLAPPCTAAQLRGTLELQGATGNLAGGISIVNRSSKPCALLGRPKLGFAGATSKWRETRYRNPAPFDPLAPPRGSLRALPPGEAVSVGLWWSNWCGRGSRYGGGSGEGPTAMLLKAPGGGTVTLRENRIGGGRRPLETPPCYASPSTLGASRFTPYVPQGAPSSELPLRARIVFGVAGTTGDPSFAARPGSWLSYTVVLTNRSEHVFRFGGTCPTYTEGGFGKRLQAYVLNCRPVGPIGPGKSVRFAVRLRVPRHFSGPAFGWTLAPHTWNAPEATGVVSVG